ncbi:zinc finger and BTB domain-containing protein 1 isoform X2 [Antennarius striatus]|uniref:zinc finger and BTB domain-containing protein 1 isoform X2 n=1 Tax=Antennarius striatus TaxID=241820 RepID=UPI0035B38C29
MVRPSHSDHVLQQLNNQREWGFLCDCLIAIGDIYFRAHKAVLAACSSYFRMMFIRDQQGAGRLDLSNMQISAECFDLILQLMYLGRIVVGSYEFEELKASMAYLQMYYIPDSLEDLRDIRSSNLTPSSSASSSSSTGVGGGKMMFGVRMYEQQRSAVSEAERLPKAVNSTSGRPPASATIARPVAVEEVANAPLIVAPLAVDGGVDQPCDLRKRPSGKSSTLKDRPRFGRTYTCDDCGFVFSCEKLLIEHILTCTNRKAFHQPRGNVEADNDSSKAESSASESIDEHRLMCKGEEDWPEAKMTSDLTIRSVAAGTDGEPGSTRSISIKTEPEEGVFPEIEMVRVGEHGKRDCGARFSDAASKDSQRDKTGSDREPEPGVSGLDNSNEPFEGHMSSSEDSGVPTKLRKVKDEKEDAPGVPCELCGTLLTEEDKSTHYLSNHMGHICACGRCGQVLIKGRQLQEHAERCGESQGEREPGAGARPVLPRPGTVPARSAGRGRRTGSPAQTFLQHLWQRFLPALPPAGALHRPHQGEAVHLPDLREAVLTGASTPAAHRHAQRHGPLRLPGVRPGHLPQTRPRPTHDLPPVGRGNHLPGVFPDLSRRGAAGEAHGRPLVHLWRLWGEVPPP